MRYKCRICYVLDELQLAKFCRSDTALPGSPLQGRPKARNCDETGIRRSSLHGEVFMSEPLSSSVMGRVAVSIFL